MNLKVILRNVGLALLVSALFMFLSILVSVSEGNDSALAALMISFVITFSVGAFPFIFVRKTSAINLKEGYMIIVISWVLSFLFGMMPYLLWGGPFTVANAWFESVSGFTTTGGTILDDVEALPRSLLFWRSSTHFIGGLGVAVFLLLIIPQSSPMRLRLSSMELSSLSKGSYGTRTNKTVYVFTYVYLAFFAVSFVLYVLGGMPAFDAVTHAFTICSTGGFSPRSLSMGYYGSNYFNIVTTVLMVLASCHYAFFYLAVVNRSLKPFNNPILKYYLSILAVAAFLVTVSMKTSGIEPTWGKALMTASFNVAAYSSTTGLSISDNMGWNPFIVFILLFLSLQCGMAGSTSGGLKADRGFLLFKAVRDSVKKTINPYKITDVRVGSKIVRQEEIYPHLVYLTLFFFMFMLSVGLCYALGNGQHSVTASVASLSNVGLSFDAIGSSGSYGWMNSPTKFILTVDMLMGRLEIYPVLAIFYILLNRKELK